MRRLTYLLLPMITYPNDPDVIIKIDVSNTFNTSDRVLTLDMISGRTSWDYACVLKGGDVIPTVNTLSNLFGYFKTIHTFVGSPV
jgi:hypothetical protein